MTAPGQRDRFLALWGMRFPGAALPIVLSYTDDPGNLAPLAKPGGHLCLAPDRQKVEQSVDGDLPHRI